jgi:hypothetical protein
MLRCPAGKEPKINRGDMATPGFAVAQRITTDGRNPVRQSRRQDLHSGNAGTAVGAGDELNRVAFATRKFCRGTPVREFYSRAICAISSDSSRMLTLSHAQNAGKEVNHAMHCDFSHAQLLAR